MPKKNFMKKYFKALNLLILLVLLNNYVISQVLSSPESIVFDAPRNRYLISNAGNGTIHAMNLSGQLSSFVSSLNSPKGMFIQGNNVYVTDVTNVKGFSLTNGSQVMNINISGSSFLNDICGNGSSTLYVSDMQANVIYRINTLNSTYSSIVTSGINKPNGLFYDAQNNRLLLCNYNTNAVIQAVNLTNNSVSTLATTTLSNFDGLAVDDSGFVYVSSWGSNSVYRFNSTFTSGPTLYASGYNGPADIYYNTEAKVLAIPGMNNNQISFKNLLYPVVTASGKLTICPGDIVNLTAVKGSALTYSWKNNGSAVGNKNIYPAYQDGNFTVSISNHVTTVHSDTFKVKLLPKPQLPNIQITGKTDFCLGDSVILTGPTNFSYRWSDSQKTQKIIVKKQGTYTLTTIDTNNCSSDPSPPVIIKVGPSVEKPLIQITGKTQFCEGDSAILSGPAGFNYMWSNNKTTQSISVKSNANISLVIYDNNYCQSYRSDTVKIIVNALPAKPVLTASGKTEFCAGDSVIIEAPSGYKNYIWNNSNNKPQIIVKHQDTFFVKVVNNNNCISKTSDTIIVIVNPLPSKPIITKTTSTEFCEGDSAVLSAPNGFIKYNWSTGDSTKTIIVKSSLTISLNVIDNKGCTSTESESVKTSMYNKPLKPVVVLIGDSIFCETDSVVLICNQTYPNYLWSNNQSSKQIIVKQSGYFSVKVTDQYGCFNTSEQVSVKKLETPAKAVISKLNKDSLTASVKGSDYKWYYNNLPLSFSTQSIPILGDGKYKVMVFNVKCPSEMSDEYNYIAGGISEIDNLKVKVYPNPVKDFINIEFLQAVKVYTVECFDITGKKIRDENYYGEVIKSINWAMPEQIQIGVYFFRINTEEEIYTVKVIKERN